MDIYSQSGNDHQGLNKIILEDFPTPISVMYKKMLDEERWQIKTQLALDLFEVWMKSVTLQMLIQYLDRDIQRLDNEAARKLNGEIGKIFKPLLGDIIGFFFRLLEAYKENSGLLFMPELYDIQWEAGVKKTHVRDDFDALVTLRNELAHGRSKPQREAEWQLVYQGLAKHLETIIEQFKFVTNYRIVYSLESRIGKGKFLLLRGLEPKTIDLEMRETESVQVGRFYLDNCGDPGCFYELHPLFLPWPSDFLDWEKQGQQDASEGIHAAIYDSYIKNKVRYTVATEYVKDLVLVDEEAIERFLQLFEEKLHLAQTVRTEVKNLHWMQIKRTANEITEIETETIREKFSKDLYLQRQHIKLAFEHFLKSDKVAFVLLGKSGVGKSNFVLSMHSAYDETQDTQLIVLNSARLSTEEGLIVTLTRMFASKLRLKDRGEERTIANILDEINHIQEIKNKKIILAFDAINENPAPQLLLKRIDDLIAYNQYPWLKIMITSRPEAWQSVKRQCRLTESRYYRQTDTEELGVELVGFDVQSVDGGGWLTVDRFKPVELPEVYRLYQAKYHLKTNFDELSSDMKVMLRDPLALRLVAETYGSLNEKNRKEGFLPKSVRTSKLYEQYINSLIDAGQLARSDVRVFLEQKLLPLMFRPGNYRNSLDAEILTQKIDQSSGKPLAEEIEIENIVPSTGKRINQSFQNLLDAELLVKQGSFSNYEISFKYERFYDYFGGKYLFETAPTDRPRSQWYRELTCQIPQKPYIWGAIRQALFLEFSYRMQSRDFSMVLEIIKSEGQIFRDLIENTLTWYALDYPEQGIRLLKILYSQKNPLIRSLAIRAAGLAGVPEILELAGDDKDKNVRLINIQSSYFFWQQNHERGWGVLEYWADRVRNKFYLPNPAAAESSLGLSVMILTDRSNTSSSELPMPDYQNKEIAKRLQIVWHKILSNLLYVSKKERQNFTLRTRIRDLILSNLIRFVLFVMKDRQKQGYVRVAPPLPGVEEMFKRKVSERDSFLKLRPYWNASVDGLSPVEDLLIECFDPDNPLAVGLIVLIIQLRAKKDGDQDLSVIERIYHHSFNPEYPTMAPAQLVFNSGYVLRRNVNPPSKEAWEIYTRIQKSYLNVGGMYYNSKKMIHECSYMELYASIERQLAPVMSHENLFLKSVNDSIDQYRKTHNLHPVPGECTAPSIPATIFTFSKLGIVYKNALLALEGVKPIIKLLVEDNPPHYEEITQQLGITLARFRIYHSDLVDNLLEDTSAPDKLKQIVKTTIIEENLWGDYLAYRFGPLFIKTIFVPQIREMIWAIFELSLKTKTLDEWLNLSLRYIVNFIYGDKIFPELLNS